MPDVAILGIGAIGSIISAQLAESGITCHLVEKNNEILSIIKKQGILYSHRKNTLQVKKNLIALNKIEKLPKDIQIVFLTTKCNSVLEITKKLISHLKGDFTLVLMTNGMIEEKAIKIHENIISCTISYGATLIEPGNTLKTSEGEIIAGRLNGIKNDGDNEIIEMLKLIDPCRWTENIIGIKFSKLLINCATASFGMISGLTLGEILERKIMRLAFLILLTEGVQISDALSIKMEKVNKFDFKTLALTPGDYSTYDKRDNILKFIGQNYKDLRSSSLASIERGEKSEIPYLNGFIVEKGKQLGIETPINDLILETCDEIEANKRKSSLMELKVFEERVLKIAKNLNLNPWNK